MFFTIQGEVVEKRILPFEGSHFLPLEYPTVVVVLMTNTLQGLILPPASPSQREPLGNG